MTTRDADHTFQPVAAIMAAALPGLGYLWYGDIRRGLCVFAGVMGLFLTGLLVGGIDSVDRVEDKWWFLLQAGTGPTAFVVDTIHQHTFKTNVGGRPQSPLPAGSRSNPSGTPPSYAKSVGRVNEAGMLMAALAGMMNVIAVIDCLWHAPSRREKERRGSPVTLRVGSAAPATTTTGEGAAR